ncbi:MAG TPA: dihydrodipicolinate synthase family protein [Terriglobales bacterium]|nr:dihydrodipicolinate synthase family protein [Terriglobales bacterium]
MFLHGIFPPLTTPFDRDGAFYPKKLEHNVALYSRTPVAGMVILGSTGEAVMLNDDEYRQVLRVAREAAEPEKVLLAGTGVESARNTLLLIEYAAKLGYDAALVRTPHFYRPSMKPENLLAYYRTVADRSPLPVVLYSVPPFTAYDLPVEVVAQLAEHRNIIGIKESSGNVEKVRALVEATRHVKRSAEVTDVFLAVTGRMKAAPANGGSGDLISPAALVGASPPAAVATAPKLKTRSKEVGFQVLVGSAHTLLPSLEAGGVGAVLAFASAAPTACYEVYTAFKEGNAVLAREKQERITGPSKRVAAEFGIAGLKYAMELNGYYGGPPRLPLLPPTADVKAEIERLMANLKN